jgi:hypothetical protein
MESLDALIPSVNIDQAILIVLKLGVSPGYWQHQSIPGFLFSPLYGFIHWLSALPLSEVHGRRRGFRDLRTFDDRLSSF